MMKKTTMTRLAATLTVAATLSACDYSDRKEFARERSDRAYRSAMTDYQSGRLAQAIAALKEVCAADPANGSARFQLACLLQDHEKDFLGAYCAFLEFLNQHPGSDKARLAKGRLADCEKQVAVILAGKYGLDRQGTEKRAMDSLRSEFKTSESRCRKLTEDLAAAMRRVSFLSQESSRLKKILDGIGKNESSAVQTGIEEAKALLTENEETAVPQAAAAIAAAKELLDGDEEEESKPILTQSPGAKEKKAAAEAAAASRPKTEAELLREKRPAEYVVQAGDTLYKIAVKFYGRSSAWKIIRDANKAIISTDGRIRAGQKLVLPNE